MQRRELIALLQRRGMDKAYGKHLSRASKVELEKTYFALPKVPGHISFSSVSQWFRCGLQWHYRYQRKLVIPPGFALTTGASFDRSANANYEEKIRTDQDEPESFLTDVFVEDFRARAAETDWTRGKPDGLSSKGFRSKNENDGVDMVRVWRSELAPWTYPSKVQEKVEFQRPGSQYKFLGFIDLVVDMERYKSKGSMLIDNKTAGKMPAAGTAAVNDQLTAYAASYLELHKEIPMVGLDTAVRPTKKMGARTNKQVAGRSPEQVRRWWAQCDTMWDAINRGFLPGRMGSTYGSKDMVCNENACGYWSICHEEQG